MTQWRDRRHAEAGSIEELGTVAAPTRVGSTRSGLIPAFIVGALLVGVVAVGVSGRTEAPRDPLPPVAAASPAPSDPTSEAPDASPQGDEPMPVANPRTGGPFEVDALPEAWWTDLRFWLVVVSDGQRQARLELESTDGFYGTILIEGDWGGDIRVRLFGRAGTNDAIRVADIRVPRLPDGSLDLPLELDSGVVRAQAFGSGDPNGRLSDLRYELRLEPGRGRPGPTLLVAEVFAAYTTTYIESSSLDEARDRALASAEVQEALTHSPRCSRMLDPRLGRSEANLDGCLRFLARQGVTWEVTPGTEEP